MTYDRLDLAFGHVPLEVDRLPDVNILRLTLGWVLATLALGVHAFIKALLAGDSIDFRRLALLSGGTLLAFL
ncbi:MAG TPA: hypothetical protein VG845_00370, partial [Dehalococcoidia bacterium]|nr:hypothetical protein [Dehalococcoidia bacterium]